MLGIAVSRAVHVCALRCRRSVGAKRRHRQGERGKQPNEDAREPHGGHTNTPVGYQAQQIVRSACLAAVRDCPMIGAMSSLRRLFAALACLAAVMTGAPAFAAAFAMPSHQAVAPVDGASKCDGCRDCDGAPCINTVDCVAPCAMSPLPLAVASIDLQSLAKVTLNRRILAERLVGEHPPPDPLPPRL